jgi:hypothetical protein
MKATLAVTLFFVAAVLAGLFVRTMGLEGFAQKEVGMPLEMQRVEGAVGVSGFDGTPPLLGSEPKPISEKPYEMADDTKLFSLGNNRMSADCCPSPFSGDRGCVCLTDADVSLFASRGGNR